MLENLFERILECPEVPLAVVGDAGTGKTSQIEAWAKAKGLPLVKLLASTLDETDVAGIVVREGNHAKTLSPEWYAKLRDNPGVLFLDEFNTARKEVIDTLLTLVCSRELPNGDKLHPGVIIIAAMNDPELYDNYELSPAMRTRFMWVHHTMPVKEWAQWFYQQPFSEDKKALIREAINIGFKFDTDRQYVDKKLPTTPRGLTKLMTFARTAEEAVKVAEGFIDKEAALILKSVKVDAYRTTANSVFNTGRTLSTASPEEAERLAKQSDVLNKIQQAAQKTK